MSNHTKINVKISKN